MPEVPGIREYLSGCKLAKPFPDDDVSPAVAIRGVIHALLQVPILGLKNPDRLPNCASIDRYYVMLRAFGTVPVYYLLLDYDRTAQ
jgi:hypothetical protein